MSVLYAFLMTASFFSIIGGWRRFSHEDLCKCPWHTFLFQATWWFRAPSSLLRACFWFPWQSCTLWQPYFTRRSLVWLHHTIKTRLCCLQADCPVYLVCYFLQGILSMVWCISSVSPVDTCYSPSTHWLTCTLLRGEQENPISNALITRRSDT